MFFNTRFRLVPFSIVLLLGGCDRKAAPDQTTASAAPPAVTVAPAVSTGALPQSPTAAQPASAAPPPSQRKPLNVLLLTIDSLRADMPWAGYPRAIAPNLTELAKKAVVYTHAYSVSSYTAKSVAAFLSGKYPSSLYRSGWFFTEYSDADLFFPELLQQAKIRTMAGHAHMYFDRGPRFNQGFDVWQLVKGINFDAQTDKSITSDKLTDLAINLLKEPNNTQGQFFAWFHYMDPHDEYHVHKESPDFGKRNRDRYDSEVYFTDLHLGRLLDFARSQPWWGDTAVIVSADHGEAFGEHGMYKHAFELWDVLTRVPLMVLVPGAKPRVIEQRRSQVDLAPTVLDLMGVTAPANELVGKSLVPEIDGGKAEDREPIVLDLPEDSHNPPRKAVIEGDYKLTVWGKGANYQLFNLHDDPAEETDLAKKDPETLAKMKALFNQVWAKIPQIDPYGGATLKNGGKANGPTGPSSTDKKASH